MLRPSRKTTTTKVARSSTCTTRVQGGLCLSGPVVYRLAVIWATLHQLRDRAVAVFTRSLGAVPQSNRVTFLASHSHYADFECPPILCACTMPRCGVPPKFIDADSVVKLSTRAIIRCIVINQKNRRRQDLCYSVPLSLHGKRAARSVASSEAVADYPKCRSDECSEREHPTQEHAMKNGQFCSLEFKLHGYGTVKAPDPIG